MGTRNVRSSERYRHGAEDRSDGSEGLHRLCLKCRITNRGRANRPLSFNPVRAPEIVPIVARLQSRVMLFSYPLITAMDNRGRFKKCHLGGSSSRFLNVTASPRALDLRRPFIRSGSGHANTLYGTRLARSGDAPDGDIKRIV
jgi:hypothetical protein